MLVRETHAREEPLPSPARHHCTEPEPPEPQGVEPLIAEQRTAEPLPAEEQTAEPQAVESQAVESQAVESKIALADSQTGEPAVEPITAPRAGTEPRVPVLSADLADQSGVLKSAKSNPGETTQVTSDSTVAEATARCHVPAGTRT